MPLSPSEPPASPPPLSSSLLLHPSAAPPSLPLSSSSSSTSHRQPASSSSAHPSGQQTLSPGHLSPSSSPSSSSPCPPPFSSISSLLPRASSSVSSLPEGVATLGLSLEEALSHRETEVEEGSSLPFYPPAAPSPSPSSLPQSPCLSSRDLSLTENICHAGDTTSLPVNDRTAGKISVSLEDKSEVQNSRSVEDRSEDQLSMSTHPRGELPRISTMTGSKTVRRRRGSPQISSDLLEEEKEETQGSEDRIYPREGIENLPFESPTSHGEEREEHLSFLSEVDSLNSSLPPPPPVSARAGHTDQMDARANSRRKSFVVSERKIQEEEKGKAFLEGIPEKTAQEEGSNTKTRSCSLSMRERDEMKDSDEGQKTRKIEKENMKEKEEEKTHRDKEKVDHHVPTGDLMYDGSVKELASDFLASSSFSSSISLPHVSSERRSLSLSALPRAAISLEDENEEEPGAGLLYESAGEDRDLRVSRLSKKSLKGSSRKEGVHAIRRSERKAICSSLSSSPSSSQPALAEEKKKKIKSWPLPPAPLSRPGKPACGAFLTEQRVPSLVRKEEENETEEKEDEEKKSRNLFTDFDKRDISTAGDLPTRSLVLTTTPTTTTTTTAAAQEDEEMFVLQTKTKKVKVKGEEEVGKIPLLSEEDFMRDQRPPLLSDCYHMRKATGKRKDERVREKKRSVEDDLEMNFLLTNREDIHEDLKIKKKSLLQGREEEEREEKEEMKASEKTTLSSSSSSKMISPGEYVSRDDEQKPSSSAISCLEALAGGDTGSSLGGAHKTPERRNDSTSASSSSSSYSSLLSSSSSSSSSSSPPVSMHSKS